MAFDLPSTSQGFAPSQHPEWNGKLFLIYPKAREEVQFPDKAPGDLTTVITADVAIVDLPDPTTGLAYTVLLDVSITSKALLPQLYKYVGTGTAALGRLRPQPAQNGKNPAYKLDTYVNDSDPRWTADAALAGPVDATNAQWRGAGTFAQPGGAANPPVAAATPTPTAYSAATTPQPAPGAAPAAAASGPWFGTPEGAQLLGKLVANGVANAAQLDEATAKLIGSGLAG